MMIVDCKIGNLRNVQKVFEKLGVMTQISDNAEDIEKSDALVLPGVGAFGDAMNNIKSLGLLEPLRKAALKDKKPILGICLGMQLLGKESFELGHHQGLNILPMSVKKLETNGLKLPHIGWNNINIENQASLFNGIPADSDFYFVHSYNCVCEDQKIIAATCEYGKRFVAAIQKDNIFATQFHPEKSQAYGFKVIRNFVDYVKGQHA